MKPILALSLLVCLCACLPGQTPTPAASPTAAMHPTSPPLPSPADIFAANRRLQRTVNLGNALEAPHEGDWGVTLQADYFRIIAGAGFTAVRVPLNFADHALPDAPFTIEKAFFDRVDWVVRHAAENGLVAILDLHNYPAIMTTPAAERTRFLAIWKQIAEHYRDAPDGQVYFELLNEPHDALTNPLWNDLLAQALALVRQTNPHRPVILGPSNWNALTDIPALKLPDDPNLIVTFHYYSPFQFTHQGAEWADGSSAWLGTTWDGTSQQYAAIQKDFESVANWATAHNRPVFLGEFGAYSKGDLASRARWTAAVRSSAEAHDFAWGYWEFCAGFGVYDPLRLQWRPELLSALIPNP